MIKKSLSTFYLLLIFVSVQSQLPYQQINLTPEQRAKDLTGRLTLEEKTALMMDTSKPVERLGIKGYNWWNEALHGVARAGLATVFPQPVGMAATFEPGLIYKVFDAVSDEARAKNTLFTLQDSPKRYQGLTMWTPNINIFRDPRWGRGMETYGEDPYLTSVMGVAVVKGLQGPDDAAYDKLHACAKHFAVHSGPEWNRHSFNAANISRRELYETYLPAFKSLVQEADVKEVMCAYNRFEGHPCCGSNQLLNSILREEWGYKGIVVADCGAIADFYKTNAHATHPDAPSASSDAVKTGTDLDCGSSYRSLNEAVSKGLINEKDIDVSVIRLLKARFELGEMDDPALVSWSKIPASVIASAEHDSLAYLTALKSIVLLQNKNQILPLKSSGLTIAVMGPNANDSVMQWGNYNGTPPHTSTILEGIRKMAAGKHQLIEERGCDWVERTLFRSQYHAISSTSGKGFHARYWNNMNFDGEPVAEVNLPNPINLCASGATVFAPGVQLTNFSATYSGTFVPEQSGEVQMEFFYCGSVKVIIDDIEVKTFRSNHGARKNNYKMKVEKGKSYQIRLDYQYSMGDAQLNFDLGFRMPVDFKQSIENVKEADVVIFTGGISPSLEGEEMGVNLPGFRGGDRTDIELPAVQRELIRALHQAGKKVIFLNCSGSAIGLTEEVENCEAILQVWYPGQAGGKAVADVLSGKYNPSGKLPVSFYKNVNQLPDFEDYNMKGRTYRYMKEEPLFPFGYGQSYTTFEFGKPSLKKISDQRGLKYKVVIPVKNKGENDGEEVIQVYLKKQGDNEGPTHTLRAFQKVMIPAGKSVKAVIYLTEKELEWWNEETHRIQLTPGKFQLLIGNSSAVKDLKPVSFNIR